MLVGLSLSHILGVVAIIAGAVITGPWIMTDPSVGVGGKPTAVGPTVRVNPSTHMAGVGASIVVPTLVGKVRAWVVVGMLEPKVVWRGWVGWPYMLVKPTWVAWVRVALVRRMTHA